MANGDRTGVFALTGPLAGSDTAKGLRTTTRAGDTWVLNGTKRWIGKATFADDVCAARRSSGGRS